MPIDEDELAGALDVLRRGGIVACPTETFVGLLADALDADAVARVAELKGRGDDSPIAVLVPDLGSLASLTDAPLPARARTLADRHWPGPLTLLVHAKPDLPPRLCKAGKVGVRIPGESPALALVRAFGGPLTATSANRSGEPPVRRWSALDAELQSGIDAFVSGTSRGGSPSTIVDATVYPERVVRHGAVPLSAEKR